MGGNLFPKAQRMSPEECYDVSLEVRKDLKDYIRIVGIPESYSSKESFGDIDIITNYDFKDEEKLLKEADRRFGEENVVSRGDGFSFLYKDKYQVDLINCPENPCFALAYHHYNDLVGMLGLICRQYGLKLRNQALSYPVYMDEGRTQKVGEVHVSRNWDIVLSFLGLPVYEKCKFNTLEDIFKYVASSKLFRPYFFDFGNLTSKQRLRNSKRPTFIKFNAWLQNLENLADLDGPPVDKDAALEHFYFIEREAENLREDFRQFQAIKAKFNGNVVTDITGLTGLPLGQFMDLLREKSWFNDFIQDSSPEQIKAYIEATYQKELLENAIKSVH